MAIKLIHVRIALVVPTVLSVLVMIGAGIGAF